MTNYVKKTIRGAGMVFVMGFLASIIAYVTRIVLARNLEPAEYGLFSAVFALITFFLFFRELGVSQALVKYVPEFQVKEKYNEIKAAIFSVFSFQMLSTVLLIVVFFFSADFLAEYYFKDSAAVSVLRWLLLYLFGSLFFRLFRSTFNAFQNIKVYSILELLKNSLILFLLLVFFYFDLGLYSPVYAYALVCYLVVLILLPSFLRTSSLFKYKIKNFWPVTKKLFFFGLPIFAASMGGKFISNIDTLILTHFRSLSEVGIYNVILPSALLFLYFGSSVTVVIFPMISELWAKNDRKKITDGLRLLYRYSFVVIIPPALTILVYSKHFISVFFGDAYIAGTLALQILIIGVLLYVVAGINIGIITAVGKPKTVAKIITLVAGINTVFNLILIPSFGIEGAAFATALSYFVTLVLSTNRVLHYIPVDFPKDIWLKLVFAGVVFYIIIKSLKGILVLNPWIELFVSIIAAVTVYFILAYLIGIIDLKEIKKYYRIMRK